MTKHTGVYAQLDVLENNAKVLFNLIQYILEPDPSGSKKFLLSKDYHTTLLYSRVGDYSEIKAQPEQIYLAKIKDIQHWTTHDNCIVLLLSSNKLQHRHMELMRRYSLEWDYPDYQPHVTICYDTNITKEQLSRLKDKLVGKTIHLSNEKVEPLDEDHSDTK